MDDQQPNQDSTTEQQPIQPTVSGKKILCIEDEHFISELYTRALQKAGYQVTTAVTGPEGLAAAQTNQYDIILLDIMLPEMTGIEVIRRLKSLNQMPKITAKIVVATNLEQAEDQRAEIENLADGYVIKAEITPHELVDFLGNLNV